jgi:sugar phosphate isomerase/epimerase
MKYGFMPSFEIDLISEIKFARKCFDFIEITLKLDLSEYTAPYISKLKRTLNNFEVLGHIHWEIKLPNEINKIYENIRIFKKLNVKKITIHPYPNIQNVLFDINDFCKKNKLQLLIENSSSEPFNKATNLAKLTENMPNLGITLDIGHANRTSKIELNNFLKKFKSKIKHIHLHDNVGGFDHLFFKNRNKFKRIITEINSINYNGTITLEMFSFLKNNQYISVHDTKRRELLIKQLEMIKQNFGGLRRTSRHFVPRPSLTLREYNGR